MQRPRSVVIASLMLLSNVAVLLIWWILVPAEVKSNGALVFFAIFWLSVAISLYRGLGWVRYGLIALIVVFLSEILNAREPWGMVVAMGLGDQISKLLAVVALVLLFLPDSHHWYTAIKRLRKSQEASNKKSK